jgi:dTDP-4-dehydrorhamnose reductase
VADARASRQAAPGHGRNVIRALTRHAQGKHLPHWRALGITPLVGDLDQPISLRRLGALAQWVLHLAPPPGQGAQDARTLALARVWLRVQGLRARRAAHQPPALRRLNRLCWRHQHTALRAVVYASTTGVYGDCRGDWVHETRALAPQSARAGRRVAAERTLRALARQSGHAIRTLALRIPGIYAPNREGGTPRARLLRGTPCLAPADDVYTNHIHADDLARAAVRALALGRPQRAIHVVDDTQMKAGDYFDAAADLYGLPRPKRLPAAELKAAVTEMQWSFLRESRRLANTRMKRELRLVLRHPQVLDGLRA